jgi:hypothetical protein
MGRNNEEAGPARVTREQVIAYRVAAQGLHRQDTRVEDLAVLDLGIQDSTPEAARLAFDVRLSEPPADDGIGPGEPLALVWSLRGAPHVHRRADLDPLAGALYPLSEADAAGRLNETAPSVARAGIPAMEQYVIAVREMRAIVTAPTAKGAASGAVTKRIPEVMWRNCRACKAHHISDSAMRPAALAAGLELQPGTSPPVLRPRPGARVPKTVDVPALQRLIVAYLALLGPATEGDVAGYLDARRADIVGVWPGGLVPVDVEGRAAWLPAERLDALLAAPAPEAVRLLAPFDPYLQARDRDLIVPDAAAQKTLWPVLGRPGVLLVDGEVAGVWRPRVAGRRLTLAVEAFVPLPPSVWAAIGAEAERMAVVRRMRDVTVSRSGG